MKNILNIGKFLFFVITLILISCDSQKLLNKNITDLLPAQANVEAIASHLLSARENAQQTSALALHFPDMNRETAYQIQLNMLQKMEAQGKKQAGWKMGGTRIVMDNQPDPTFGYILDQDIYQESEPLGSSRFVNGSLIVEAEIALWISKDLPGPQVTRQELREAITKISAVMELPSARVQSYSPDKPLQPAHSVADNMAQAGVILGKAYASLSEIDFQKEEGLISVNGQMRSDGPAHKIMGIDPFEAVLWLANELPKYGQHLRAGDFVITGSIPIPQRIYAGDKAEIRFTSLGTISLELLSDL